ncbi:MAG: heme lyase CcmF/NrfE family subunit, partial [Sphingomonas sp.]|nr:heme lyase CcmF/NrfE family subunit [Sphingomonas sp.]
MIAEAGLAALWLAAAFSLFQALLGLGPEAFKDSSRPIRAVAVVQGGLTAFAMLMLVLLFARTDLSVALVVENSHSAKQMLYKLSGAWGNHEGSMLLWVTVLGASGAVLALLSRRLDERTFIAALGAQGALALGFFTFLLLASNPFGRLDPAAAEGRGLNPLLQDPGLAFHPPTLYFGYVGLSVAFSLAVGALLTGRVDRDLAKAMRPWVLGAWIFLTLGITAGSYWAYYELGWGGWWFWDPVENASLMPWLAATALLHSVNVLAARDSLRAWTVMLAMICFSLSMVGTFLVRSGILTSVHSFAVDPQRGTYLLILLGLYVGAALTLFAVRSPKLAEGPPFELVSREAALVGNNLLLSVILGIVFIGTLYPLFVEAATGEKLSVGAPYFNTVAGPIALVLAAVIGVGPLLNWRSDSGGRLKRLVVPGLIGITVFAVMLLMIEGGLLEKLAMGVAAMLLVASLLPLFGR